MSELLTRQQTFASNVWKLLEFIYESGYAVSFGETYRTQQQAEWNEEHGFGVKESLHCERLAVDLNLFKGNLLCDAEEYRQFGTFWKTLHPDNRHGLDFTHRLDPYHFSMKDGSSNRE